MMYVDGAHEFVRRSRSMLLISVVGDHWKRWMVALCVTLLALVMAEKAFATDKCHAIPAIGLYNITLSVASSMDSAGGEESPLSSSVRTGHCCSAHIAAMPVIGAMALPMLSQQDSKTLFREWPIRENPPAGLDRPPRSTLSV